MKPSSAAAAPGTVPANGNVVALKVETFTFSRCGLLHGTVTGLSQDAVAPQDAQQPCDGRKDVEAANDEQTRKDGESTYIALMSLQTNSLQAEDGASAFEPGMAVTAEITAGGRTVMSYLLSPLLRFEEEGFRKYKR